MHIDATNGSSASQTYPGSLLQTNLPLQEHFA